MSATNSVHGHDIIHLVISHPDGIKREELTAIVNERYGVDATFHTCSEEGMNLDALLVFLEERDKVWEKDGIVGPGGSPPCDH